MGETKETNAAKETGADELGRAARVFFGPMAVFFAAVAGVAAWIRFDESLAIFRLAMALGVAALAFGGIWFFLVWPYSLDPTKPRRLFRRR